MKLRQDRRCPSWAVSLIPFSALIILLFAIVSVFGSDSLNGASQLALLASAAIAVFISLFFYGIPWSEIELSISNNIRAVGPSVLILFMIGAISGTWMVSGIVPTLMYYGLKIISPGIFLFAACIICALVSLVTGSSWTTIATIGVALIGVGTALGYSPGWSAGAIISGAYFGDKISPLSDTTVLASSSSETPLFTHIRYMLITTVPSILIASVIYLVVSLLHGTPSSTGADSFSVALSSAYNLSPWLLTVPVLTGIMIARKLPALLTLFVSALMAGIAALIAQPGIVLSIGAEGAASSIAAFFKGFLITFYGDTSVCTGNEALDALVSTHGMTGMLNTVFLVLCAATFGGALTGGRMIQSLTEAMKRGITGRKSLVGATLCTGIFSNMATGDQYLSIILTTNLYKRLYAGRGFESRLLSRSVEDSATVTSVLIPWNSCGMTQSTVLRVATLEYLPFCFFNLLSPLVSMTVAILGYKIFRTGKDGGEGDE